MFFGILLPMSGIKNFVLGFGFSLASMSIAGQFFNTNTQDYKQSLPAQKVQIELFKTAEARTTLLGFQSTQLVDKKTITTSSYDIANLSIPTSISQEGSDDDEILSINIDNIIPIELEDISTEDSNTQILNTDESNNLVAMLPNNKITHEEETSPWIVTKGSNFIDNKNLIEANSLKEDLLPNRISQSANDSEFVSYKVAEKIKQSILFPIPDEILNDENLTPTFIKKKATNTNKEKYTTQEKQTKKASTESNNKGILTNITSWLKDTKKEESTKKAPSYSSAEKRLETQKTKSTEKASQNNKERENSNFVSFYQTLQDTTKEFEKEKITPSELKLSFRPDRAEISGQTLRWIKAFSEKAKEDNTFLQIRIDANAPIELQKKRLNLLYSIFMNNGVDLDKIDTIFSLTEQNTFIIRILTTD